MKQGEKSVSINSTGIFFRILQKRIAPCCFFALIWLAVDSTLAHAQVPVNCGDNLNEAGQRYILTTDLVCTGNTAVTISANRVYFNLNGHSITGPGVTAGVGDGGIQIQGANRVQVSAGTVRGFSRAIFAGESNRLKINNMTLTENGDGMVMRDCSDSAITNNTISRNINRGLFLISSHSNEITDNTFTENAVTGGIGSVGGAAAYFSVTSNDNIINSNDIYRNSEGGVVLQKGSGNVVRNNFIFETRNAGGIVLDRAYGSTIVGNTASQGQFGVLAFGPLNGEVTIGNTIKRNTALGNSWFDLGDGNHECASNIWKNNNFKIAFEKCIR